MIRRRFNCVRASNPEGGQGLIVVLFIALILMALVVAATTITASQVVPSRQSIDSAAALAAAEGGVNDFIVDVNTSCKTPGSCAFIASSPVENNEVIHTGRSQFSWRVLNPLTYVNDGFVRVLSIGTINPGSTNAQSRTLIADIKGSPNLLDYLFVTKYETQSAASVRDRFKIRSIPLDGSVTGADFTKKVNLSSTGSVAWNGAGSSTAQPTVDTCDTYWYNSTSSAGTAVPGRQAMRVAAGISDPNNAGVDWGETGIVGTTPVSRTDTCEISFSTVSKMNGKVYSEDALLISSSVTGGAGPTFRDLVQSKWSTLSIPAADSSKRFRTFAQLPASAPALGSKLPQTVASGPILPTWDGASAAAAATCTYTGPTRIRIVGANVVVTSPLTPTSTVGSTSYCYTSTSPNITAPLVGSTPSVFEATYPYTGKTIYVKNVAVTTPPVVVPPVSAPQDSASARTSSNSIFRASGPSTVGPSTVQPATAYGLGTWTNRWAGTTNTQGRFESEIGKNLATFTTDTRTAVASAAFATVSVGDALHSALISAFNGRNSPGSGALIGTTGRSYEWAAPVTTTATAVRTTTAATYGTGTGVTSDPLMAGSVSSAAYSDATVQTASTVITRNPMTCVLVLAGLCIGTWNPTTGGAILEQIQVTAIKTTTASGTISTSISAFPVVSDRTQYAADLGDAYIEGTIIGAVSIAAENDVIVTGDIKQASGTAPTVAPTEVPYFTSTDAVVLAAKANVLVYHPVSCRTAPIAGTPPTAGTTTAGYCPNDVTGLYTGGMSSTTFDAAHPSRQYINLLATPVLQVDAAIYALTGSFQLMNYNRGVQLGTLKVNGGIYQSHHGVTGVEWETLTTNSATRRQSGYNLDYLHDRTLASKGFPWVPASGVSGLVWNLQGITEKVGTP